jgi:hypothetical protein
MKYNKTTEERSGPKRPMIGSIMLFHISSRKERPLLNQHKIIMKWKPLKEWNDQFTCLRKKGISRYFCRSKNNEAQ